VKRFTKRSDGADIRTDHAEFAEFQEHEDLPATLSGTESASAAGQTRQGPRTVYTVMVDYGSAAFLWSKPSLARQSVGVNVGDAWGAPLMSEALFDKFAAWSSEFGDDTHFYSSTWDSSNFDWVDFHARGIKLTRLLKAEVQDRCHILYEKPVEDPNCRENERVEVMLDGSLRPVPVVREHDKNYTHTFERIVSGAQTGAERAGLDLAIDAWRKHGGWTRFDREAEDGRIAAKYQVLGSPEGDGSRYLHLNVADSDGTLAVNIGALHATVQEALALSHDLGKPSLLLRLDRETGHDGLRACAAELLKWLRLHQIKCLHVTGPSERSRPGMYRLRHRHHHLGSTGVPRKHRSPRPGARPAEGRGCGRVLAHPASDAGALCIPGARRHARARPRDLGEQDPASGRLDDPH
jgi:hypothetical protein